MKNNADIEILSMMVPLVLLWLCAGFSRGYGLDDDNTLLIIASVATVAIFWRTWECLSQE